MDSISRIKSNLQTQLDVLTASFDSAAPLIESAADLMAHALLNDGKVLSCGNGGSAALCQHFSALMLNRYEAERPSLPALDLTADCPTITSIATDYQFEKIYSKQIFAFGYPGDILLTVTTSGNSPNIIHAIDAARQRSMHVIILNGKTGGEAISRIQDTDVNICVDSDSVARIHEFHLLILHCLCDLIDFHLLGQC